MSRIRGRLAVAATTTAVVLGLVSIACANGRSVNLLPKSFGDGRDLRSPVLVSQVDVNDEAWSLSWDHERNLLFANVVNRRTGDQTAVFCRGATRPYDAPYQFDQPWRSESEHFECQVTNGIRPILEEVRTPSVLRAGTYWSGIGGLDVPNVLFAPPVTIGQPVPYVGDLSSLGHSSTPLPYQTSYGSGIPRFYLVQFPVLYKLKRRNGRIEDNGWEYYSVVWDVTSGSIFGTVYSDKVGELPDFVDCATYDLAGITKFDQAFFDKKVSAICDRARSVSAAEVPNNDYRAAYLTSFRRVDGNVPFTPYVFAPNEKHYQQVVTQYENSDPDPDPDPGPHCCTVCHTGKACGDSCISRDKMCHVGGGCACDG